MKALTLFVTMAMVVFSVQAASGQTLTVGPLDEGDTEVTISGYTLPEPIADSGTAKMGPSVSGIFFAQLVVVYMYMGAALSVWMTTLQTNAPSITLMLQSAWAAGSELLVVDMYTMALAYMVFGGATKDGELPPPSFSVTGFAEGSTEVTISDLPVGAQVRTMLITPAEATATNRYTDGDWNDLDGEENGTIVMSNLRWQGPPHVISGEMLIVALAEEGGGLGAWTSEGTGARVVIPVVSHIIGASGVPFISDLTLSNSFALEESGWVRFVPEGAAFADGVQMPFTLAPGESQRWSDVLSSGLGLTENTKGTLIVGGTTGWNVQATSRNYAVDGDGRRFGIAVPGLPTLEALTPGDPRMIPGLRQTSDVRSNLILAGAAPQQSQVEIRAVANGEVLASTEVTVPGYGLKQLNRVVETLGVGTLEIGYLELEVMSGAVFAALSVVDGSADDAALELPRTLAVWR